ncbi:pentatricopeptide repeat-containing protein At4g35130, chloroplastic-like, partial [Mercurialis annua]|uniref:pentatricopeptide repeat-containing protein At4g35130, chloroplastic-like n=1 Tax=Mercurialis annua TaxID=3986 RepID=UPI0021606AAE
KILGSRIIPILSTNSSHFNAFLHFFTSPKLPLLLLHSHHLNTHKPFISLLNSCKQLNTLTWNLTMKTSLDAGLFDEVLFSYKKMKELGVKNDTFTFPIINRAVLSLKSDVAFGKMVHCDAIKTGFGHDLYYCNTMIEVYVKYGFVCYARKLFDEMPLRDLVSWTSMISGYVCGGCFVCAFELFNEMRLEVEPNSVTLIVMLQGCYGCDSLSEGKGFHCYAIKNGLLLDRSLQNSILKMYSRSGSVEEVESFFVEIDKRDVISWNILIGFYSGRGDAEEVVGLLDRMHGEVDFSSETLTLVVSALAKNGNLVEGEKLHSFSIKSGLCDHVLLASFLDFYAKCGELSNSVRLFEEISSRSSITWNTMMSGYIRNGYFGEAISLFRKMQASGIELQAEILGSLVEACSHLGALQLGKEIHGYLTRNVFYKLEEDKLRLQTSILNMYVRCGSIVSARECFDTMVEKDNITWTSMIEGYGVHGMAIEAVQLFDQMLMERVIPNSVTFLSLLSACSHSGLIRQGFELFHFMKWRCHIEPDLDHYTSMVDLLGRCGKIREALTMIMKMVVASDSRIWGALLAACRVHGDKKAAEFAARRLLELESDNVGYYTILSNIQASVGNWNEVEEVRIVMHDKDLRKTPGWSYIEERGSGVKK